MFLNSVINVEAAASLNLKHLFLQCTQ